MIDVIKSLEEENKMTDRQKQELFETIELPTLIKNKKVPTIVGQNDTPLFIREPSRILIHFYFYNILVKRNLLEDIVNFFKEDSNINEIIIFDNGAKKITFYLNKESAKGGLFILPMRYDDEGEESTIDDNTMHYTVNAAKIIKVNNPGINTEINERTMHFYTIIDQRNKATYLPAFTVKEGTEKMYPANKYRYCTVSYDDLINKAIPYNGIVINPMSLGMILSHNILDGMAWINMEVDKTV